MTDMMVRTKLRPEVKEAWVAALRSGEYEQGYHNLRSERAEGKARHCCLGVLCELANQDGVGHWEKKHDTTYFIGDDNPDDNSAWTPPQAVLDWAMDSADVDRGTFYWEGNVPDPGDASRGLPLYALNDGYVDEAGEMHRLTFSQIADIIEAVY